MTPFARPSRAAAAALVLCVAGAFAPTGSAAADTEPQVVRSGRTGALAPPGGPGPGDTQPLLLRSALLARPPLTVTVTPHAAAPARLPGGPVRPDQGAHGGIQGRAVRDPGRHGRTRHLSADQLLRRTGQVDAGAGDRHAQAGPGDVGRCGGARDAGAGAGR